VTAGLPAALREFIYRYCATLPALEALMMFHSGPDVAWTAELVRARLGQFGEQESADVLAEFHWHGFLEIEPGGTYRYQPRSAELQRLAADLAAVYEKQRLTVVAEVARLASLAPLRSFSDAFRVRKVRPDG
jgi:hypothetical protein